MEQIMYKIEFPETTDPYTTVIGAIRILLFKFAQLSNKEAQGILEASLLLLKMSTKDCNDVL